jgi:hypothetical protein
MMWSVRLAMCICSFHSVVCGGRVSPTIGFHQRKRRRDLSAGWACPQKASLLVWDAAASSPSCFAGSLDLRGGDDRVEAAVGGGH